MASEKVFIEDIKQLEISKAEDFYKYKDSVDVLTIKSNKPSKYCAGFAVSPKAREALYRLRYLIFNVELGEGLQDSHSTGMDKDEFDDQMTHLCIMVKETGEVVGTYRLQTAEQGLAGLGLYCAREFELDALKPLYPELVELGRACLTAEHRNMETLIMLWLGIGAFMTLHGSRFLFGCSSITSLDPDDGWRAMRIVRQRKYLHPEIFVRANPDFSCGDPSKETDENLSGDIKLPKLFNAYMRLGTQVISEPAIDRDFGTVDFLILLDGHSVKMSLLDVLPK